MKRQKEGKLEREEIKEIMKQASFFEAAGAAAKIGLSLKPNHHNQV